MLYITTQKHTNQICLTFKWSRWTNLIKLPLECWLLLKGASRNIHFPNSGINWYIFLLTELPWIAPKTHGWVLFIWCFSHRLKLALKDAFSDFTSPVDESLMHLYYLYQKSFQKVGRAKAFVTSNQGRFSNVYGRSEFSESDKDSLDWPSYSRYGSTSW